MSELSVQSTQAHIAFIHKLLRRREWIKYDYMETDAT
jgi:hypothetical protein